MTFLIYRIVSFFFSLFESGRSLLESGSTKYLPLRIRANIPWQQFNKRCQFDSTKTRWFPIFSSEAAPPSLPDGESKKPVIYLSA